MAILKLFFVISLKKYNNKKLAVDLSKNLFACQNIKICNLKPSTNTLETSLSPCQLLRTHLT